MVLRSYYRRLSIKWKLIWILTGIILFVFLLSMAALSLAFNLYDRQLLNISSDLLNLDSTNIENELRKIIPSANDRYTLMVPVMTHTFERIRE
ncbi:hypothetical protein [Paenibacillus alkalitolerans]|uniref:hypothetical protein n=1 Tax=Paenibacillus alkalitolerans TaxID=2799335 RepID=UPI0018F3241B|nr:hypothetical protein [Paenibacillus alkalitolerans]